jgi:cytochrome P450 family 6
LFKIRNIQQEVEEFFTSIVNQTIKHREASKENERKDFMQLLIQLKDQGFLTVDRDNQENGQCDEESHEATHIHMDVKKLTELEIAAQAFLFFTTGFETSSSTMNNVLLELSKNQDKQKKVH